VGGLLVWWGPCNQAKCRVKEEEGGPACCVSSMALCAMYREKGQRAGRGQGWVLDCAIVGMMMMLCFSRKPMPLRLHLRHQAHVTRPACGQAEARCASVAFRRFQSLNFSFFFFFPSFFHLCAFFNFAVWDINGFIPLGSHRKRYKQKLVSVFFWGGTINLVVPFSTPKNEN